MYDFEGHYLIVFGKNYLNEIKLIFQILFELYIVNADVIVLNSEKREEEALLYTFFPFEENKCGAINPILWNTFTNKSFIHKTNFFPKKLKNMNKCRVKVATIDTPPFMTIFKTKNNYSVDGIDGQLLSLLSQRMNFTSVILVPDDNLWGSVYENGTSSGCAKLVCDGEANISLGAFGLSVNTLQFMDSTYSYIQTSLAFVLPLQRPLTALEKLFGPLDTYVWLSLGITAIFIGIFIKCLKSFKSILRLKYLSYFEVISIFLGNAITKQTNHHFRRNLALNFLLASLIIRTAYQGILFKNLQQQNRIKETYTVNKLIDANFTFFMASSSVQLFNSMPGIQKRTQHLTFIQIPVEELNNPYNKHAYLRNKIYIDYFNFIHFKHGNYYPSTTDDIFLLPITIFLRKSSYFRNAINEEIEIYMASGLINHWIQVFAEKKNADLIKINSEPKKLTVDELLGGFEICLMFYGISLVVLFFEIIIYKFKIMYRS